MVSKHNVSKQMEEAYKRVQEDLGIQIYPRHVDLSSGSRIPITGLQINRHSSSGLSRVIFTHPHESGAEVYTSIDGPTKDRFKRGTKYFFSHHSIFGNPHNAGDFVYSDPYTSQEDIHSRFIEHLSKTDNAIRSRGGVDPLVRDRVRGLAGKHSGVYLADDPDKRRSIKRTSGMFDEYGRFTENKE